MLTEKDIDLDKYDLEGLKALKAKLTNSNEIVLKGLVNIRISELEARKMNEQFDFKRFPVIEKYEMDILERNGITNLQQLIDADLTKLVDENGMFVGNRVVEYCDWARHAFDMSSVKKAKFNHTKKESIGKAVTIAPTYRLKKRIDKNV